MLVSGRPDVEVAVEVPGAGRVPDSGSPDVRVTELAQKGTRVGVRVTSYVGAERGEEVGSDVPPGTHEVS